MHGWPVIGFVLVAVPGPANVPGKVPGVIGETGFSVAWGKVNEVEGLSAGTGRGTDCPAACAISAYPASMKGSNIAEILHLRCFARIENLPSISLKAQRCGPAVVPCGLHNRPTNRPTEVAKKRIKVAVFTPAASAQQAKKELQQQRG
jgi:hypothetical protein